MSHVLIKLSRSRRCISLESMEKRLRCKIRLTLNQERGTIDRSIDLEILLFFEFGGVGRICWRIESRIFFCWKKGKRRNPTFGGVDYSIRNTQFSQWRWWWCTEKFRYGWDEREKNRNVRTKIERGNGKKCDIYDSDFRKSLFYRCIRGGRRRRKVKSVKSWKEKQRQESLLTLMAGATCESRLSSRL